jgi:hypothetical protein
MSELDRPLVIVSGDSHVGPRLEGSAANGALYAFGLPSP